MGIKEAFTRTAPAVKALNDISNKLDSCKNIADLNGLKLSTKTQLESLKKIVDNISQESRSQNFKYFYANLVQFICFNYGDNNVQAVEELFGPMIKTCDLLVKSCNQAKITDFIGGSKIKNATIKLKSSISKCSNNIMINLETTKKLFGKFIESFLDEFSNIIKSVKSLNEFKESNVLAFLKKYIDNGKNSFFNEHFYTFIIEINNLINSLCENKINWAEFQLKTIGNKNGYIYLLDNDEITPRIFDKNKSKNCIKNFKDMCDRIKENQNN